MTPLEHDDELDWVAAAKELRMRQAQQLADAFFDFQKAREEARKVIALRPKATVTDIRVARAKRDARKS